MFVDDGNMKIAKIRVIGIGGAGNNAVNRMIEKGITSADFVAINTDRQALMLSKVPVENRIQIGENATKGLGAGSQPELGEQAAEETKDEIERVCEGVDLLFIAAGMGGGTGTGAAPVVAKIARDKGCLTVAVITKPFAFEGKKREANAVKGIANLTKYVDTIIIIPNDKLLDCLPKDTPMRDALTFADDNLRQGVCGISDLISTPALINLDFADVRTIIKNQGLAHMGVGRAKGENRVIEAVRQAVSSPLLETTIEGASGVIINITGGKDLSLGQVYEAAKLIQNVVDESANIIFGANINEDLQEEIIVTLIATGFKNKTDREKEKVSSSSFFDVKTINEKNGEKDIFAKKAAPSFAEPQNVSANYAQDDEEIEPVRGFSRPSARDDYAAYDEQRSAAYPKFGSVQAEQQDRPQQPAAPAYSQASSYAQAPAQKFAGEEPARGYAPAAENDYDDDFNLQRSATRRVEFEENAQAEQPKQEKRELPSFVKKLFGKK